jgi:hypothetical protein
MSNCQCRGENSNCFYCDGTGIKRERVRSINKYNIQNFKVNDKIILKRDKLDFKNLLKSYSLVTLKSYKKKLLSEKLKEINDDKKNRYLELIDSVTFEIIWRQRSSNVSKKLDPNLKFSSSTKFRKSSEKRKQKTKSHKNNKKQSNLTLNTQNVSISGLKIFNQTKKISERNFERILDGSKDFYKYRESGKFGSFSSFDDFGDESFS